MNYHKWQLSFQLWSILPYHSSITDSQTIQQIHEDNHNEEDKAQQVDITNSSLDRQISKFQFSNKHGECFDYRKAKSIKKGVFMFFWIGHILMEKDIESQTKGKDEQGVPS